MIFSHTHKPESKFWFNRELTFPFPSKSNTAPSYLGLWGCLVISHRCKGCTGCPSLKPQQQLLTSLHLLCHKKPPEWTCKPPTQFPCRPVGHQPSQFIRRGGAVSWGEIYQSCVFTWVPLEGSSVPAAPNKGQRWSPPQGRLFRPVEEQDGGSNLCSWTLLLDRWWNVLVCFLCAGDSERNSCCFGRVWWAVMKWRRRLLYPSKVSMTAAIIWP